MLFEEAVKELKKGSNYFVTRDKWEEECGYLVFLPGVPHFIKVTTQPQPGVASWAATREDVEATDWKIVNYIAPAQLPG